MSVRTVNLELRATAERLKAELQSAKAELSGVAAEATKTGQTIAASMQENATSTKGFSAALDRLALSIREESAAMSLSIQRNLAHASSANESAAAATRQARAMHDSVSEIQATSGALRVLEGSGGIRAAERFLTTIPGLGAALQVAFPVIGAIALFDAFGRLLERVDPLAKAEKNLADVTKEVDSEFDKLAAQLEHLNVQQATEQFGKLAGLKVGGFFDESAMKRDEAALRNLQNLATQTQQKINAEGDLKSFFANPLKALNPFEIGQKIGDLGIPDLGIGFLKFGGQQKADIVNLQTYQQQIQELQEKIAVARAGLGANQGDITRTGAQQGGQLQSARIGNEEQSNSRLTDIARQFADLQIAIDHATAQARINAMHDVEAAVVASAAEEVRVAKEKQEQLTSIAEAARNRSVVNIGQRAGAESAGKTPDEQAQIQVRAQGEIAAARDRFTAETLTLQQAVATAQARLDEATATSSRKAAQAAETSWREAYDAITKAAKETSDLQSRHVDAAIATQGRVSEIGQKGAGQTQSISIDGQKLAAERAYGLEVIHTAQQQISFARQIAAIEDSARTARITGLAAELQTAESLGGESRDVIKIAELKQQIAQVGAEDANASYAAQTNILDLIKKQSLEYQIQGDLLNAFTKQIPEALGSTLANIIFPSGSHHESAGKQFGDAAKGIGKSLVGQVATQSIERLIAAMLPNTAAVILNTASHTASSAASAASGAASAAGGVASAAGGAASAAGSATSSLASGLLGPLISAAGGVVGGVISGVLSLHGSHEVVNAVNQTTAAVNALRSYGFGVTAQNAANPLSLNNPNGTATAPGGAPNSQAVANTNTFMQRIGSFFGFGTGGTAPIPVSIVSFSPLSPLRGLFHLFGEGTDSAPGGLSIVGDKGPELMNVPRGAQIIPNHVLRGAKAYANTPGPTPPDGGSSYSSSIGQFHFHAHGIQDPGSLVDLMVKKIPNRLKSTSPVFGPSSV